MFSRRRSRTFLLDTVNRGAEFVETLKIIFPKTAGLHEKDFDWLFDCPQTEQFLEWFCNTVGDENLLSPTEVEAYEKLLVSEKPVMEGEALGQVLKTCRQSCQLKGALQENEALPLDTIEQEMKVLKSQGAYWIKRRNTLQICAASLKQELCHLAENVEKASAALKKMQLQLDLENIQSNDILSQASKIAKELAQWHREPGNKQLKASVPMADLGCYLEVEENITKALLGFFPKLLPDIVKDTKKAVLAKEEWGGSWQQLSIETAARLPQKVLLENKALICGEDFEDDKITTRVLKGQSLSQGQLASKHEPEATSEVLAEEMEHPKTEQSRTEALASQDGCQGGLKIQTEAVQMENPEDYNLGSCQEELGRMELAYICTQGSLLMTSAEIKGISFALQWARKALKTAKENKIKKKDKLRLRIATCQKQLCTLQSEVGQAKAQQLMPLLQGSACLLCLPVVFGELDLEAVRLEHVGSMQEKAAALLLGQLSHLELLNLSMMLEGQNLHQMRTRLEEMVTILNESQVKLQEWQSCFEDSRFSIKLYPQTLIDPNDLTTLRLWEMLDKHGQQKQLFRSYETLASRGSRLRQELRMLQVQLATPLSQLPKLESANEMLHSVLYGDSNQLMLHAQELSEPLEQLSTSQAKLYQMLMDILSDLKAKHKSLQSPLQQTERSLYVHFFNNPAQLKELVEDLEKQKLVTS